MAMRLCWPSRGSWRASLGCLRTLQAKFMGRSWPLLDVHCEHSSGNSMEASSLIPLRTPQIHPRSSANAANGPDSRSTASAPDRSLRSDLSEGVLQITSDETTRPPASGRCRGGVKATPCPFKTSLATTRSPTCRDGLSPPPSPARITVAPAGILHCSPNRWTPPAPGPQILTDQRCEDAMPRSCWASKDSGVMIVT